MNDKTRKYLGRAGLAVAMVLLAIGVIALFRRPKPAPVAGTTSAGQAPADQKTARAARLARAVRQVKTLRAKWAPEPPPVDALVKYRKLVEAPLPVKERMLAGAWEWSPTVLKVEDLAWVAPRRRECGRALGGEITVMCNYAIDMAIERTGETAGKIKYARARVEDEAPEPLCDALADCIASARLDEEVPLPKGTEGSYGITQSLQSTPIPEHMKDPANMAQVIENLRSGLAELQKTLDPANPEKVHEYQDEAQFLRYTEARVKEMQATRVP